MTRNSHRCAQAPGLGLALGAAIGVFLGTLVGGGAQAAVGVVIGAALGLLIGAAVQAPRARIATGSRRMRRWRGAAGKRLLATAVAGVPAGYRYRSPVRRPAPGRMPAWSISSTAHTIRIEAMKTASSTSAAAVSAGRAQRSPARGRPGKGGLGLADPVEQVVAPDHEIGNDAEGRWPTFLGSLMNGISPLIRYPT